MNIDYKKDYKKEFLRTFKEFAYIHRASDIWKDFVVMFACALSETVDSKRNNEREKRYLSIINKYNKKEQNLFAELAAQTILALEKNLEQDFLGDIFMELQLGDVGMGQYFTPYHICRLMAKMTMQDVVSIVKSKGYITINDPCCGSGAILIAGINETKKQLKKANINFQNHVFVVAQDIDETVALMCYIQLSLIGMAGYVKVGNALTEPANIFDTTKNYWFTPMYFSIAWLKRRLLWRLECQA